MIRWWPGMFALLVAVPATSAPGKPTGTVVRVEHRDPSTIPSRGPTNALVTIELFFTPGTMTRGQPYKMIEQLQAKHPTRIRLIYRIVQTGGENRLSYAALEAHAQGKFFEFMDAINSRSTMMRDQDIVDAAKKAGLADPDRLPAVWGKATPPEYRAVLDGNERRRKRKFPLQPPPPNVLFNGRAPATALASMKADEAEREYIATKDAAEELLDRGADRGALVDAADQLPISPSDINVPIGRTDEELGDDPIGTPLAAPPLDLRGLPSYGPAQGVTTIAVLCSPTSSNCLAPLRNARIVQEVFPDAVRLVWAPYFDVTREDAADLSLLSDAALCAERVGTRLEDNDERSFGGAASPGWRWVDAVLGENRRHVTADKLIDKVADKLHVDHLAFATCRAQLAGASIAWIEAARRAGVRMTPSTVVGGRIYGPIDDRTTLQLLIEAELAPGMLGEAAPTWRAR